MSLLRFLSAALAIAVTLSVVGASAAGGAEQLGATLYVSAGGSDSGSCTQAAPCASFNRAYHVAKPGQVVQVGAGQYPAQLVTPDPAKAPSSSIASVVFRPAPGGTVSLSGELRVQGSHVTFRDIQMDDWYAGYGSQTAQTSQTTYVGFYGIHASSFYDHASNVNVVGGSYGPISNDSSQISDCDQCNYSPQHILIDGVYFHDYIRTQEGDHMECLHVYSASYLTVRNSRFFNCAIMDLFVDNYGSSPNMHDILIENNFFDQPGSHGGSLSSGSYALYVGETGRTYSNVTVRDNTSLSVMYMDVTQPVSNATIVGNLGSMPQYQCVDGQSGVSYSHNAWYSDSSSAAKCGSTDRALRGGQSGVRFASPGTLDLHLGPNSSALAAGEPASGVDRDIDGDLRPRLVPSDAGADQQESAEIVLGRSIGKIRLGEPSAGVAAAYGAGSISQARIARGAPVVEVQTYRRHGARLWAAYAGGRVVGVGTTSRFYVSAGGVGVGSPAPGSGYKPCGTLLTGTLRGVRVVFTVSGGTVRGVSMTLARYAGTPACG